jgi:hypothetical protein
VILVLNEADRTTEHEKLSLSPSREDCWSYRKDKNLLAFHPRFGMTPGANVISKTRPQRRREK